MKTYIRDYKWGKIILLNYDLISDIINFYGEWADLEVSLFASILELGDEVIEVGCNLGMHTIPLCKFVGITGKVIGFEAQRVLHQVLCGNMAINNITNAYLYNYAIGEMDSHIYIPSLNYETQGNYGALSLGNYISGEKIDLRMLDSIEAIADLTKLRLIKIDVEGMEAEVIQGAKTIISKFRPILFVENNQSEKGENLIQLISSLDYSCYWFCARGYNPNNYNHIELDVLNGGGDHNMLCIPNEHNKNPSFLQKVSSFNELLEGRVPWVEAVDPSWYQPAQMYV
ncbi:hypothetical protein TUMEXPCC7403_13710 [Tumidithrix helvetica PCC 7403]|uniref:FkbM family methyltransferase n=1 Tax=Tumidithrix helvetica TaxID=3457545 RepID=UPI003C9E3924